MSQAPTISMSQYEAGAAAAEDTSQVGDVGDIEDEDQPCTSFITVDNQQENNPRRNAAWVETPYPDVMIVELDLVDRHMHYASTRQNIRPILTISKTINRKNELSFILGGTVLDTIIRHTNEANKRCILCIFVVRCFWGGLNGLTGAAICC
jgi:hypothetical protein